MAKIDDCLKRMRDQGAVIDSKDEAAIRDFIAKGMNEEDAVRRQFIERAKNVIDITERARTEGATITPYRDVYDEIVGSRSQMLARTMQNYVDERNALAQEVVELDAEMDDIHATFEFLETAGRVYGMEGTPPGGVGGPLDTGRTWPFLVASATDQELLTLLEMLHFRDRRSKQIEQLAPGMLEAFELAGNDPLESLSLYKEMLQRRLEIMDRKLAINQHLRRMEDRVRAMTDREWRNPDFGNLDADGSYRIEPEDPDGVAEDIINYSVTYAGKMPWTISRTGEGDFYIRRHGKNAGMPFRERQSENDMAITLDQSVLLPDFMFYVMQYLQPEIAARAKGTAQQYVTASDVQDVLINYFQNRVQDVRRAKPVSAAQGDLFADPNLPPDKRQKEAKVNYKALVKLVEEGTFPVGLTHVNNAAEAAHVLAPIRKNAQEGFWGLVLDKDNKILGIVQHSKGAIDGTSVYPSTIAGHVLQFPGAAKVWWAHNHPSGVLSPSQSDELITRRIENLMRGTDVEIQGHVLMGAGRDRYTQMDNQGLLLASDKQIAARPRNLEVPIYTRQVRGTATGATIRSPAEVEQEVRKMGTPKGVLFLDNRHKILGYVDMTVEDMKTLRGTGGSTRLLRAAAEMNAAAFIVIADSNDPDASTNMADFANTSTDLRMLDYIYEDQGSLFSLAARGQLGSTASTFNQDLVGITSGLLEAAKAMPQNKGPAEQMIAVLKKQPGVKKEEMDWIELEDWIRAKGYVTRDEIIDFVDKNGVVVEEFYFTEDASPVLVHEDDVVLQSQYMAPMDAAPWFDWDRVLGISYAEQISEMSESDQMSEMSPEWEAYSILATNQDRYYNVLVQNDPAGDLVAAFIYDDRGKEVASEDTIPDMLSVEEVIRRDVFDRETREGPPFPDVRGRVRYKGHTLEGGMNHREIVFRLPPPSDVQTVRISGQIAVPSGLVPGPDVNATDTIDSILADMSNHPLIGGVDAGGEALDYGRTGEQIIEINNFNEAQWDAVGGIVDTHLNAGAQLMEHGRSGDPNVPAYTQSHAYSEWDNILMWARINERTGPNGERILFVEEIQSDWHQTGRQFGYAEHGSQWRDWTNRISRARQEAEDYYAAAKKPIGRLSDEFFKTAREPIREGESEESYLERLDAASRSMSDVIRTRSDWQMIMERYLGDTWMRNNLRSDEIEAISKWRRAQLEVSRLERERSDAVRSGLSPPDAPFKGNAWAELAMKRLIRMAAEEGFDELSWTTGTHQNERWDLSTRVDYLEYNPWTNELSGEGDPGGSFSETVAPEELDRWIGRELADRLRNMADDVIDQYEVTPAADMDISYHDVGEHFGGLGWNETATIMVPDRREGADFGDRISSEIKTSEPADGFVMVDANGEIVRAWAGDIYFWQWAEDAENAKEYIVNETGQLPMLMQTGLQVGGRGMRNFYDEVLPSVASRAAKKLDKKASTKRFGGTIDVSDQEAIRYARRRLQRNQEEVESLERRGADSTTVGNWVAATDRAESELNALLNQLEIVHTLEITPEIQVGAMEGQTLFQDRRRGSITFDEQRKAVIRLTRARDMSTFLHESGHLYLELIADVAEGPGASDQARADFNKVLKFLGVEHRSQIKRVHHEKFARAFEAYLREGKAPDPTLRDTFLAFKGWLTNVYKQLIQLDVELNDDIRGVFDRLIATDAAITQAEQVQEYTELFATAEDMGLSPEAFEVYRRHAAEAHEDALDREGRRVLNALLQEEKAWWRDERTKVEAEVREEAHGMKIYQLLSMLQRGLNPDGSKPDGSTFKISKDSLMKLLQGSQETLNRLPRPYIYSVKGGVDVNLVAREFGYGSANEMITEVMRSQPMEKFIQAETDARMAERFPDPMTSGELQEQAIDVVHSDKRAQVLAAEMRAIRKKVREDAKIVRAHAQADRRERAAARQKLPKRGEIAFIKMSAKALIAKMRVRDVKPHIYLSQERQAGKAAFAALEKKDYEAAYTAKRQQLVNHEMYRAAQQAKDQAEKTRKYLARFDAKALRQRMGKAGVLERIDSILENFNFRKVSLAQVDREAAQGELLAAITSGAIVAPPDVVAALQQRGTNYQDLTNLELAGLRDVVRQLEMIGKNQYEMIVNGEKKNIQDTALELATTMRDVDKVVPIPVRRERRRETAKRWASGAINAVLRPGAIARILDGSGFGAFTQNIIVPIRRAYAEKMMPRFQEAEEAVVEIYRKHYDDKELAALNSDEEYIENLGESLTRGEMISVALNWGNESNRKALLAGKKQSGEMAYPEQAVRVILGKMTAKDWRFVQDIWDYMDSYWDEVKAAEQRRRGIAPQKVEAMPFDVRTADGEVISMRGGYYPLVYDSRHSKRQKIQEFQDVQQRMANGTFVTANTRAGSTHDRVENHGKVVRLGLNTIDLHLREIIRDISIGDEVNFVKRVLEDPELYAAFEETGNGEALKQLNMWLADSAVGELPAAGAWERALSYSRTGFTKAKLGWNMTTMFLQLTGVFQTAAVLGANNYRKGVAKVLADPVGSWKFVMESSSFMHQRYSAGHWNKDVADAQALLQSVWGEVPTKTKRVTKQIARTYFAPIMAMQSQVDVTTWMGAYTKGLNDGMTEEKAILFADSTVEAAQTSGFFSDRSGIERGTLNAKTVQSQFVRIWTTLISYMLAKSGLAYEKSVGAKRQIQAGEFGFGSAIKFATDMLLLFTIEGIASAAIYGKLPDEDDDEPWGWFVAKVSAESAISGIPFVRETMSMRYGGGNTVIGSLSRDAVNVYMQAAQGEIDEALIKSINNMGGTLFHYPSTQTNRFIDTAWAEHVEGEDVALYEYLTGQRGR